MTKNKGYTVFFHKITFGKLSLIDGKIHLVYVGGLYFEDIPTTESFWKFYPKITKQEIHLHIYSKLTEETIKKFRQIEKKDKYFHYEGFLEHEKLIQELTMYDFGINLFSGNKKQNDHISNKVAFSNKNFDYISAGLPIIVSKNLTAITEWVEENGIGISIDYKDITNLRKVLLENRINIKK